MTLLRPLHSAEIEAARASLAGFVRARFISEGRPLDWNWHLDYLCDVLESVTAGRVNRLIITIPPRHLKSEIVNQCWPAWMIGKNNTAASSVVSASYAKDLAADSGRKTRDIVASDWFAVLFPGILPGSKWTECEWETAGGAARVSQGERGAITGKGGMYIIVDDLLKPDDANSDGEREKSNRWYGETLLSRRNDAERAAIVIVQQRLHEIDLVGFVKGKQPTDWLHINLPLEATARTTYYFEGRQYKTRERGELLHERRISRATQAELKQMMGENYEGQYQQNPVKMRGGMLRPDKFVRSNLTARELIKRWDLSPVCWIDGAFTEKQTQKDDPDHSAYGITARNSAEQLIILHAWHEQCSVGTFAEALIAVRKMWGVYLFYGEKGSAVNALNSTLAILCRHRNQAPLMVIGLDLGGDKVTRAQNVRGLLDAGVLVVPDGATWLPDLEAEMRSFPKGAHDDQVDWLAYGCREWQNMVANDKPERPRPEAHMDTGGLVVITGEMQAARLTAMDEEAT